jgi:EmrB/QacA subfamily drug resistance transporter
VLPVLFVGVLIGALDIAIAGPALPAMQTTFGVSDRIIPWVFTIYVLFNLIGTPLMAKLSDVFGRRSIYVLDVGLFALGSLLVVIAPAFWVVLLGRAVQGLGAGGIFPVASAVIGDIFPPEKRGRALGLIGAVFGLAFILGPIIGGVLLAFSWQWLFLVNVPIALVVIVASLRLLPSTRRAARKPFDLPGLVVLALLLVAMSYGLNNLDTSNLAAGITSPGVLPYLLAVPILLVVFIAVERRAADPVIKLSLFTSRQASLAMLFALGAGLGEASVVFVPKLLTSTFGVTESSASYMLVPLVLAMAFGSPLAGRLLDGVGSRPVLLAGSAVLAAGMFVWGTLSGNLALYYVGSVLVGFALGVLLGAPLRYIMLGEADAGNRASAQGALTLFTSTGQLLGAALLGALVASRGGGAAGYESAYTVIGAIAVVLTLLSVLLKSRAEEISSHRKSTVPV